MYQFFEKTVTAKYLAAIDDHIAETLLGTDKFTDDDADEAQTDVDFHNGEQVRNIGGHHDLKQDMCGASVECADEFDLIRRGLHKTRV